MAAMTIILVGAGGHCRSCIDVIELEGRYAIAGIVGREKEKGEVVLGHTVAYEDADLPSLVGQGHSFLITIGQIGAPGSRKELHERLVTLGATFATVISPRSYVSTHATIGAGSIVMHHAMVNAAASIGANCIINSKSLVEHDAVIGDHCHVATSAVVNGGVQMGEGSFIGSGAVLKEYITLPAGSFVKANSIHKG
jgi:sugar O-acyltransferase (sialic acid O-acetyltransferase NeuD family)